MLKYVTRFLFYTVIYSLTMWNSFIWFLGSIIHSLKPLTLSLFNIFVSQSIYLTHIKGNYLHFFQFLNLFHYNHPLFPPLLRTFVFVFILILSGYKLNLYSKANFITKDEKRHAIIYLTYKLTNFTYIFNLLINI